MRAFLSHSSKDKTFVETVASLMRPGTYELDSLTFDAGLVNSKAIMDSLRRCTMFCLFLSKDSVQSPYVDFETLLGIDGLASGRYHRFIVVCLDDESFGKATQNIRYFNIVRRHMEPESAARLIQGAMVSAEAIDNNSHHPFIGREDELRELETQFNDFNRRPVKALYVSGNVGCGRRTVVRQFYSQHFSHVGVFFPEIFLNEFAGKEELYRSVVTQLRPSMRVSELRTAVDAFQILDAAGQDREIARMFSSLQSSREAALLIDGGGLLNDSGKMESDIDAIVSRLETHPHPSVAFISRRMTPRKLRRSEGDIAYLSVDSLSRDASIRLIKSLIRARQIQATEDQVAKLFEISEGHPYNIYRMIDDVKERGISAFLASPADYLEWRHRQSSEYVERIALTEIDIQILYLLTQLPELDFETIVSSLGIDPAEASLALHHLSYLHMIEGETDLFRIAPAIRVAVERDRRVRLPNERRSEVISLVARSLVLRIEDGAAPVGLLDTAIISAVDAGATLPAFATALLLPSHKVWLAKRHYDQRHWTDCIRLAADALDSQQRLSNAGFIAACRYLCLAGARVANEDAFKRGINLLKPRASDDWAKSNVEFLQGFNLRLKGRLPEAEKHFRASYELSPGNISAGRELSSICLSRGNVDDAERFAREAYNHASGNPYVTDILVSVLCHKRGKSSLNDTEIADMLDRLRHVDSQGGHSFYLTRAAELQYLWGDNKEALSLVEEAIRKTPNIFEPHRIRAQALIRAARMHEAQSEIDLMKDMVLGNSGPDRRTNHRAYLVTLAKYLAETNRFQDAKDIYNTNGLFSPEERTQGISEIERIEGFAARPRH